MQKTITLLFCLAFANLQHAQITITSADMPNANDTLRYSESILDSISRTIYLEGGVNKNWNFTHLRPIRQDIANYQRAISTPYGFFFLGFNRYGVKELDSLGVGAFKFEDIYSFFNNGNDAFRAEGIGMKFQGLPIPSYYRDEDEIYQFPLQYGSRDSSTFAYRLLIIGTGSYGSEGYRINEVDGWGKIETPFGVFDCIRVTSELVSKDSLELFGIGFSLPTIRRAYKWLAKGSKIPILEISGNVILDNFIPTRVRYRDQYRDIDLLENFAPTANFKANLLTPSTKDTVQFTSLSSELALHEWIISPSSYRFVNSTNASSRNPQVIFSEAGKYDVSLIVTNPAGSSDTTFYEYIEVSVFSNIESSIISSYDLKIYPNPSSSTFIMDYQLATPTWVEIQLFTEDGKLVQTLWQAQVGAGNNQQIVPIPSGLPNKIYRLKTRFGTQTIWHSLVIQ